VPISTDIVQLSLLCGWPDVGSDLGGGEGCACGPWGGCRPNGGFDVNLKRLDKLDEKARRLEPGDTIFIDSVTITFREVFDIATTTALIAATIANVILAYKDSVDCYIIRATARQCAGCHPGNLHARPTSMKFKLVLFFAVLIYCSVSGMLATMIIPGQDRLLRLATVGCDGIMVAMALLAVWPRRRFYGVWSFLSLPPRLHSDIPLPSDALASWSISMACANPCSFLPPSSSCMISITQSTARRCSTA